MRIDLTRLAGALLLAAMVALSATLRAADAAESPAPPGPQGAITLAVMDPLAAPLSCDCVKGYAQRDYGRLAAYLETTLQRRVRVVYGEDLARLVSAEAARGGLHFVIGKQSVVRFDAAEQRLKIVPLCLLTDKAGDTNVYGLFCVRQADPAKTLADLKGYTIFFGPEDSVEKHGAALLAMKAAGLDAPARPEVRNGCTDAALAALEAPGPAAAVISSYAVATLEGCGTIEQGALRVVGKTAPVPFITVFATEAADDSLTKHMTRALLELRDADVLTAIESRNGFVRIPETSAKASLSGGSSGKPAAESSPAAKDSSAKKDASHAESWPGWRGPNRDGTTAWLPDVLPAEPEWRWRVALGGTGLGGIAATDRYVIVPDRDALDTNDVFRCLDAASGKPVWELAYPAPGKLDYGNSPRATPLVHGDKVYALGAMGDVHCVSLEDGRVLWKTNVLKQFGAKLPTWGMCASPLIVDNTLILNPGAPGASVVALDAATGELVWKAPGAAAAYSSFIFGRFGGADQIVGFDALTAFGLDPQSGRRLWTLPPKHKGDFHVPTPVSLGEQLLLTSENNGTRVYGFAQGGAIKPTPLAHHEDLAPDTNTPVVVGNRVFGCWNGLYCLSASGLEQIWVDEDEAFEQYASLIASTDRLLAVTTRGELLLYDAATDERRLLGRLRIAPPNVDIVAHPAISRRCLFVRIGSEAACLPLN